MSSNIEIQKICEFCGCEFIARKTTSKYCSHACNSKAYKIEKRKEKTTRTAYMVAKQRKQDAEAKLNQIKQKDLLTITETAIYIGVSRPSVYSYLQNDELKSVRLGQKTFIRRADIDLLFDNAEEYSPKARPNKDNLPISEFYTVAEIKEKFAIKEAWLYQMAKKHQIPKTLIRGKTHFSKQHIDRCFKNNVSADSLNINDWYSVEDIVNKYHLSLAAIYSFVSENHIAKCKIGRKVYYARQEFDVAKGYVPPVEIEYYTIEEAMTKYNMTRDALYHYVSYHKLHKVKEGRNVKIAKSDLDNLFNPIIE